VGASLYSLVFSRMLAKKAGGKRMANQEHLDTLLLGVTTWKDWKKQNPAICLYPHLSDANLGKANLLGALAGHSFVVCAEPNGECCS
jgi:hypothetical protein